MKNNKLLFTFLFVLGFLLSYSQDLIMKRDSSVIFCKIVQEDNTTLYYRQKKGEQMFELNIKKADVLSYFSGKANVLAEIKRADSIALVQTKRDSVKRKKDTLQTKLVAQPPKKDTLLQKAITIQSQGDTIILNSNYKCFYKGELITRGEALALMKGNTQAHQEMKKARANFTPVVPLYLGAVVLATVFIADAMGPGNFHWLIGGSCVIAAALAITFKHNCNIHLYQAVKLYNSSKDIAVTYIPKFELGAASNGIGLCLKF